MSDKVKLLQEIINYLSLIYLPSYRQRIDFLINKVFLNILKRRVSCSTSFRNPCNCLLKRLICHISCSIYSIHVSLRGFMVYYYLLLFIQFYSNILRNFAYCQMSYRNKQSIQFKFFLSIMLFIKNNFPNLTISLYLNNICIIYYLNISFFLYSSKVNWFRPQLFFPIYYVNFLCMFRKHKCILN